jgi:hypothetical protein
MTLMKNIIENLYHKQEHNNFWNNSLYKLVNLLKLDYSGNVGEIFLHEFCNKYNIPNKYFNNINSKNGTYDIIIKNKKIEIKTARLDKRKIFQHEHLRNDGCDYYIFLDIAPNYYYVTILPKFDLSSSNNIINKKAHLRKGTFNIYKLDFSEKQINTFIEKELSIKIQDNEDDLYEFIMSNIL